MNTSAATINRRRSRRRSDVVRRRRRLVRWFVVALAVAIVVPLALPLFRKAVNELTLPLNYASVIRQQAAEKHLDPALIAAVIYAETKFDPRPSSAGAEGLMQILPQTAEFLAHRSGARTFTVSDLGTPQVNIAYGTYYLRYLLDEYGGSTILAIAAYNGGETNVGRWLAAARAAGHSFSLADIPFSETRAYVGKVLDLRARYRASYARELGY
jgi:soluble lytic murein transglycosylase